jgi:site-specific DNA-methyltransferase (adenine-specific)
VSAAQASFALRGRNPDVLTCIANLSNDEVFTPPELANRMLDALGEAWGADHDGADIWTDPDVKFLDPFTKSGVFLREVTSRLTDGLANEIPDLQERVDHILMNQVFGIGVTYLTSLLARRSLYCSKWANGPHSIARSFAAEEGSIWFERMEHTWTGGTEWVKSVDEDGNEIKKFTNGKCKFCGATQRDYDRGEALETHAYAFIHTDDIKARICELFGDDMRFDVIIGNPPYQLGQSGGDAIGNFAMPVYQKFVQVAKSLDPRYVVMITPSRWFAGGRGLDEFRKEMLADRRLRVLVDFPESREVFAGVDIAGGVSYFLWDSFWDGQCEVSTTNGGVTRPTMARFLGEYDILVRYNEAVSILHRVLSTTEGETFDSLANRVAPIQPFSLRTNFRGKDDSDGMADPVLVHHSEGVGYIDRDEVPRNVEWVDQWKVIVGGAVPAGGRPDKDGLYYGLIGVRVLPPGSACTETYLVANRFSSRAESNNFAGYLRTKFARFLIWLRTNTHHLYSERFAFVPNLPMDRPWTDADLYQKYGITNDEQTFIESMIRPMDSPTAADDE